MSALFGNFLVRLGLQLRNVLCEGGQQLPADDQWHRVRQHCGWEAQSVMRCYCVQPNRALERLTGRQLAVQDMALWA